MIERLIKQLEDGDDEVRRNAALAVRGIKDSVPVEQTVKLLLKAMQDPNWRIRKTASDILVADYPTEAYFMGLLNLLGLEGNAGARNSAVEVFVRLGRDATDFLMSAFDTPDCDIRKFIIDIIGQNSDRRALPLLLKALNDEDENVRAAAVEYLGNMREATVVDRLVEIVRGTDLWTAYPAVEALGRIGDAAAIPALVEALSKATLKEPALRALAEISDAKSLVSIVPLLDDKSKSVQHEVLITLEKFYHKGISEEALTDALRAYLGSRAITVLLNHAWSSKHEVRVASILFLGLLRDASALEPLIELSQEENYYNDVKRALVFIGKGEPAALLPLFDAEGSRLKRVISSVASEVGSKLYYDRLVELLKNDDGHVRSNAMYGLLRIGEVRAIPAMIAGLTDQYIDVQETAVDCLSRFDKASLDMDAILRMLQSSDPVLRKNVANLIGKLGMPSLVGELCFVMKDADTLVRRAAINALAGIKTAESMQCMMRALTDEDVNNRISAILGIGAMGGESAVAPLLLVFSDEDEMLKVYAVKALGSIGSPMALPELIKLFDSENGFVVNAAIEAVSKIGGSGAVDALRRLLASRDNEIRRTAIRALALFDGVQEDLMPFLTDRDWATRAAAVEALACKADQELLKGFEHKLETEDDPVVRAALQKAINDGKR